MTINGLDLVILSPVSVESKESLTKAYFRHLWPQGCCEEAAPPSEHRRELFFYQDSEVKSQIDAGHPNHPGFVYAIFEPFQLTLVVEDRTHQVESLFQDIKATMDANWCF